MTERRSKLRDIRVAIESWPLIAPFRISGYRFDRLDVLTVEIAEDGIAGRGEATGIYYRHETPATMAPAIETVRPALENGVDRTGLLQLLPSGGARNAVDAALWDLEAKRTGDPVWRLAGLDEAPRALTTTFTIGAEPPEKVAVLARQYAGAAALKLKLAGDGLDAARVKAARAERPDAWIGVDANQGLDPRTLATLLPHLRDAGVALLEQPFRVGMEAELQGFDAGIPIAADESFQSLADLDDMVGRFQVVNIKLDKCGGLTEALQIVARARELGLGVMVGNMMGTTLGMAPAFVLGQLCDYADLDGPILLQADRPPAASYAGGKIDCAPASWGYPSFPSDPEMRS